MVSLRIVCSNTHKGEVATSRLEIGSSTQAEPPCLPVMGDNRDIRGQHFHWPTVGENADGVSPLSNYAKLVIG